MKQWEHKRLSGIDKEQVVRQRYLPALCCCIRIEQTDGTDQGETKYGTGIRSGTTE